MSVVCVRVSMYRLSCCGVLKILFLVLFMSNRYCCQCSSSLLNAAMCQWPDENSGACIRRKKNVRPVDCCGFGCVDWLICRQQFEGRRSSRRRWHFNVWIRSEIADAEDHDRSISLWWPCCTWLLRFYLRPMVTGVTFLFKRVWFRCNWNFSWRNWWKLVSIKRQLPLQVDFDRQISHESAAILDALGSKFEGS